jgi:hypothetical protein
MMKTFLWTTSCLLLTTTTAAFCPTRCDWERRSVSLEASRREILLQVALLASSAAITISPPAAASSEEEAPLIILNGVPTTEPSSFSVADTDNDSNNEFIQMLKARSDANRDANAKEATRNDKLSFSNFRDQYHKPSFKGVRQPNTGEIKMVILEEFEALQAAGKIKVESGVKYDKKGNAKADYSQQVYVLVQ